MTGWRYLLVFRVVMVVLFAVVQLFFYLRIRTYLRSTHKPGWLLSAINILFTLFNLAMIISIFWRLELNAAPRWFVNFGIYPFYVWHYSFLLLFLLTAIGKFLQLPFLAITWVWKKVIEKPRVLDSASQITPVDATRRRLLRQGFMLVAGTTFAASTFGILRRDKFDISGITVPITNLPDQLDGFAIGLISDIHSSIFMTKEQMQDYASVVNSLGSDLIAVTGDFVNSMVEEVYPFAEAFSVLRAPCGVFGVLGNHDYFTRNVEVVAKEVNSCGIKLLRNSLVGIEKNGTTLHLLGLDDLGNGQRARKLIEKAVAGIEGRSPTILMCHRPYFFPQAAERNIGLTLSGHTHGGQIVFARIGNDVIAPARMVSPYVAGLYSIGTSHMYVSRGIGTVGVPIRLNCPPEITKITLRKA